MPKSIKSTKKWWKEGAEHVKGKQIIRAVAKKYGAGSTEESRFAVDLHDIEPELWPKKSVRGYQCDLLISKRKGKEVYQVIAEIDGEYHSERKEEDDLRDRAIFQRYGLHVKRFQKERLLKGEYSEEYIATALGLI